MDSTLAQQDTLTGRDIPQAEGVASVTVLEVLGTSFMRGAEVVAGTTGLSRPVESVGVLDVMDLDGVQSNQFLISNAYPLRDVDMGQLLDDLGQRGVSALGIKLSEYWARIPAEMLQVAEKLALPVLVLPEGPFDEIVNPLLSLIAARQVENLQRSSELHAALTDAVLGDESRPEAITRSLTRAIGAPVGILDDRGEVVAASGPDDLWASDELRWKAKSVEETCPVNVDGARFLAVPVRSAGRVWGTILAFGIDPRQSFARAALAQASVVTSLLLLFRREVERVHLRFEQELLEDLIERRPADPEEAKRRAVGIGWPVNRPYAVAILRRRSETLDSSAPFTLPDGDATALLAKELALGRGLRVLARRHGLTAVIHLKEGEEPEHVADSLARRIRDSQNVPWTAADMICAVSDLHLSVIELPDAYYEAVIASVVAEKRIGGRNHSGVTRFADLGPIRVLTRAPNRERLFAVARRMLAPLSAGVGTDKESFETLEALLFRNMNLSAAAADLFFHYNTVRYRFDRIRRQLGGRLESPEGRLGLSLAVAALRLEEIERRLGLRTTPADASTVSI